MVAVGFAKVLMVIMHRNAVELSRWQQRTYGVCPIGKTLFKE
jgi:hypothetical protein